MPYPVKMRPYYRHGEETPWGGSALRSLFGKQTPDERTGESLEISALPGMESVIENGSLAGKTLREAAEIWGRELSSRDGPFPLLAKIIDAREMLSVQVHPDDNYAKIYENKLGKTEAWVVLDAPRGSELVYGVDTAGVQLRDIVSEGRLEGALRKLSVAPGDVLYIPHGLVHALGGGIMVYEIQQSSDVTYRFYDWGRVGADGKPRTLHTEKALDVTIPDLRPEKLAGATVLRAGGSETFYICDDNFCLSRLNVAGDMPLSEGKMRLLTALGPCALRCGDAVLSLNPGDSALVPALCERAVISGRLPVLSASLPDGDELRKELGYRAANVAGLGGSTAP